MAKFMLDGQEYGSGGKVTKITQAEYDALPESKYTDGVLYAITDGKSGAGSVGKPIELTKAQYEALGDSVLNDNILYAITDGDGLSAKGLPYDDSETQLGVNNVQDAIKECFQYVSDGKALVASAITDKGVTTAQDATFEVMAEAIQNIQVEIPLTVKTESKTVTLSTTWSAESATTINFTNPFKYKPSVTAKFNSAGQFVACYISDITETSCVVHARVHSGQLNANTKSCSVVATIEGVV